MKTLIYITIISALCGACRSPKEKVRKQYFEKQINRDAQLYQSFYSWDKTDSVSRYWQYSSDTAFKFNPVEGLLASGGNLLVQEFSTHRASRHHDFDSLSVSERSIEQFSKENMDRKSVRNGLSVVHVVLLVVVVAFFIGIRRWIRSL